MSAYFEEVLKKMGWVDGLQVPVANAENKALEEKIAELLVKKIKATAAFQNASSRHDALEKHLKHVQKENEEHQVKTNHFYIHKIQICFLVMQYDVFL